MMSSTNRQDWKNLFYNVRYCFFLYFVPCCILMDEDLSFFNGGVISSYSARDSVQFRRNYTMCVYLFFSHSPNILNSEAQ